MLHANSNISSETSWEKTLASYGIKRDDQFYRTDKDVIDAKYAQVDGHQGGGYGGNANGNGAGGAVNDPQRGMVIRGPWLNGQDGCASESQGADETSASEQDYLPFGWICNTQGVFDNRSGRKEFICGPLKVTQKVVTKGKHFRELKFRNTLGDEGSLQILEGDLHATGQSLAKQLANAGLDIVPGKAKALRDYLHDTKPARMAVGMEESGWQDDIGNDLIYLLADSTVIMGPQPTGMIDVVPASAFAAVPLSSKGTLAAWVTQVAQPASQGKAGILGLCAGFAPLLLKFAPERINFLLNLHGTTSVGKSTLLQIAASIWGEPKQVVTSWNGTEKGLLDLAKHHHDRPLVLDELGAGKLSPEALIKLVYSLAGGESRVRSSATGKVLGGKAFRCMVISSAEYSLQAAMKGGGKELPNRGTIHRALDIEMLDVAEELPEDERKAYVTNLQENTKVAYGTAGKAFLMTLVQKFHHADDLRGHLSQEINGVLAYFNLPSNDSAINRGLEKFALLVVAGELAVAYGLIPAEAQQIRQAISYYARVWYSRFSLEAMRDGLIERIASFLQKSQRRFENIGGPVPANRVGWRCVVAGERCFGFTSDGLKEATQEHDVSKVAQTLQKAGLLSGNDANKVKAKITIDMQTKQRTYVYAVNEGILTYVDDMN